MKRPHRPLLVVLALGAGAASTAFAEGLIAPEDTTRWEGALGLLAHTGPEFSGSDRTRTRLTPGFFVRYGRFTLTNASGFVTRRADDVVRGLGADLVQRPDLRVNLALRFDAGRNDGSSAELTGMGDIKPTVRLRLNGTWRIDDHWRLGAGWTVDAFGRGGGNFGEASLAREHRASPDTVWAVGSSVTYAGDRYQQTYYGVTPQQSQASGYAVYEPAAGLRDATLFGNVRSDLSRHWTVLGGASVTRLLGPSADSPLARSRSSHALNAGLAYRF